MSRITTLTLAGLAAAGLTVGTLPAAQAAPFPAMTGAQVGGGQAAVDQVGWRYGYGGYGYRRRGIGVGGALAAGAAIGLLGGAAIAATSPRYGYYGGYGYAQPVYGYARPAYGYPAYGYGYPAYGYGYPAYGW